MLKRTKRAFQKYSSLYKLTACVPSTFCQGMLTVLYITCRRKTVFLNEIVAHIHQKQ